MESKPAWADAFDVLDESGVPLPGARLPLNQTGHRTFVVTAELRYRGETGLDPSLDDRVRVLPFDPERTTDLASVPALLRWFVNSYGNHTPAALYHDHLLGPGSPITAEQADRYFLSMLTAVRVPLFKRLIMWAAVVFRTRLEKDRWLIVAWIALSATGLTLFVLAAAGVGLPGWLGPRWLVLVVAGLAPFPASLLWRSQWPAALIAAAAAIWALPAAILALAGLAVYWLIERVASRFD